MIWSKEQLRFRLKLYENENKNHLKLFLSNLCVIHMIVANWNEMNVFFHSRTVAHWCRGSHCRLIVPYSLEKSVRALLDREKSGLLGKCNPAFLSSLRGLFTFCSSLCWQFRLVSREYSLVTPSRLLRSNRGPYNDPVIDCTVKPLETNYTTVTCVYAN